MFACFSHDVLSILEVLPFVMTKKERPRLVEIGDDAENLSPNDDDLFVTFPVCSNLLTASFETSSTLTYVDDEDRHTFASEQEEDEDYFVHATFSMDDLDTSIKVIDELVVESQDGTSHDDEIASLVTGPVPELGVASFDAAKHADFVTHLLSKVENIERDDNGSNNNNGKDEHIETRDDHHSSIDEEASMDNDETSVVPLPPSSGHDLIQPQLMHHMVKLANVGGGQMLSPTGSTRFSFDDDDDDNCYRYGSESSFYDTSPVLHPKWKKGWSKEEDDREDTKPVTFVLPTESVDDETTLTDVASYIVEHLAR